MTKSKTRAQNKFSCHRHVSTTPKLKSVRWIQDFDELSDESNYSDFNNDDDQNAFKIIKPIPEHFLEDSMSSIERGKQIMFRRSQIYKRISSKYNF